MESIGKQGELRVAIIHDWFITIGGAEKVLSQLLQLYPDADVFCVADFFNSNQRDKILLGKNTKKTYIQQLPFSRKLYRFMVPFLYKSIERFDLNEYDLILSSSHSIAKGVRKSKDQIHICYCHTPMRYVWNMKKTYIEQIPFPFKSIAMRQLQKMKDWDFSTAQSIDYFITNSHFVASRIKKNYNRESQVIHPPVDKNYFTLPTESPDASMPKDYFLVVSRLVHYKKIKLIIETFNNFPNQQLIIIGEGPQEKSLKKIAAKNTTFVGYQSNEVVKQYFQNAKAVVLAAVEDFGITSLEAQACGTPIIALNYGGYTETVVDHETGLLFKEQTVDSLSETLNSFLTNAIAFDEQTIRKHAEKFSNERFKKELKDFVDLKLNNGSTV